MNAAEKHQTIMMLNSIQAKLQDPEEIEALVVARDHFGRPELWKTLKISIHTYGGARLHILCEELCRIASALNIQVCAEHNDRLLFARPGDCPKALEAAVNGLKPSNGNRAYASSRRDGLDTKTCMEPVIRLVKDVPLAEMYTADYKSAKLAESQSL